jgi:AcrR family transcriptional regulator
MVRPRSARAHGDVLDAALALFADRGIDATSMDAIAQASGVSKATIYKHWSDKNALCLEVLARIHGRDARPPDFDSGDLRADLAAVISRQPPERHADLRMRLMPHLMAYAARNPAFGKAWQACVFEPPRAELARALALGIARGQLPRALNVDLAIALLLGPMMYGHLLKRMHKETPGDLPELVVDAFMKACARPVPGRTSSRAARRRIRG